MSLSSNMKIKDCLLEVTNIKISVKLPFIVSLEFVEDHSLFILKEKNWQLIPPESYNMF